jgi:hypothetical protein
VNTKHVQRTNKTKQNKTNIVSTKKINLTTKTKKVFHNNGVEILVKRRMFHHCWVCRRTSMYQTGPPLVLTSGNHPGNLSGNVNPRNITINFLTFLFRVFTITACTTCTAPSVSTRHGMEKVSDETRTTRCP